MIDYDTQEVVRLQRENEELKAKLHQIGMRHKAIYRYLENIGLELKHSEYLLKT